MSPTTPEGELCAAPPRWYRVRVTFREPTWELVHGASGRAPFHWTHDVLAPSSDEARLRALRHFRRLEVESGVGWVREVSEAVVEPVDQGGPAPIPTP